MTNFKPNDNLEYIRALTGPTLVKDGEEQPRLPTLILGDGLKLTTNLALRTHRLDVEGEGGGDASLWAEYPAVDDVNMDGHKITGLGEPTDASDAATKGYVDDRLPELEWWDPTWTPASSNIDSVSNVECQYTRVYRAAGGSLVTLEGTITVEIDNDNTFTLLSAPLPVPATTTGALLAPAICTAAGRADRSMVRTVVTDTGSGPFLSISAPPLLNATGVPATLTIGFRVSYRAV